MSNTTMDRPMVGDSVLCKTEFGPLRGWLSRYITDTRALVDLHGVGLLHVAVADISHDPEAVLR